MLQQNEKDRLAELEKAFVLFNQTSNQLTQAYEALQDQVVHLQAQLAKSDHEKHRVADRLERLLTLLPAGVIVLNTDNQIIEMNPSAADILGSHALGDLWAKVVERVFVSRNDAEEFVSRSGTVYQLSQVTLDQALGTILLIQDVTAARQLQDHVNRHQRLRSMGEMAASLAHQIRTPLAAALLYVSQLSSPNIEPDKRAKFTHKVLLNLKHLEGLVKDMLQYAKGGSTGQTRIEVGALLEDLCSSLEQQVNSTESQLFLEHIFTEIWVRGDRDSMITALQNLVINAIDVVRLKASIRVSVALYNEKWVDLIVSDQGPGIALDVQEKIFEPFFTSRAKGTGLGLAVVRTIAEAHGGEVWLKSQLGKGAQFGIRLPLCKTEKEICECS
ncbi:PAS domain-containing protein [Thiomicrospira microaerophila]|uniref:sensor histidine kinase n=1 Tax=Thiomicrospira microaerophila TaxID=406020 RepID=UPI00200DE11B|nr:ATP-binding protein [Thiomicrospira microaerophila]UQB41690.1 PAS domain-containing protein [Thiomicrospira microaerophila]